MKYDLNPPLRFRQESYLSQPMIYHRGAPVRMKRSSRKASFRLKHVLALMLLLAGVFFIFQRLSVFLLTWDRLMIRDIRITCREAGLENKVRGFLQGKKLGNILLFDNAELQASLKSIRPVKNVRVRKLFPSALEIQVEERTARAVIKQSGFHMVDEEGVLFETAGPAEISRLPLLIDSHDFVRDSEDKLRLARECLNGLSPEVLAQVAVVDLSESDRLSLVFRDSPIRFILGGSRLSEKIEAGRNAAARLEKEYGPLDSIDLRFEDRLYLGLKEVKAGEQTTDSGFPKEAT